MYDYEENLRTTKNTDFEQVKTLFDISQRLILNQKREIYGISTVEWVRPWVASALPHDRAIKPSKAKVHVYYDPISCLGKFHDHAASTQKWKEQIGRFMNSKDRQDLNGIDGEPMEFEWNIFPGHNTGSAPRNSKNNGTKRKQT